MVKNELYRGSPNTLEGKSCHKYFFIKASPEVWNEAAWKEHIFYTLPNSGTCPEDFKDIQLRQLTCCMAGCLETASADRPDALFQGNKCCDHANMEISKSERWIGAKMEFTKCSNGIMTKVIYFLSLGLCLHVPRPEQNSGIGYWMESYNSNK